jgi:hypothetical protein
MTGCAPVKLETVSDLFAWSFLEVYNILASYILASYILASYEKVGRDRSDRAHFRSYLR